MANDPSPESEKPITNGTWVIGMVVQNLRKYKEIPIPTILAATGFTYPELMKVEAGTLDFRVSRLVPLAYSMGVTPSIFMGFCEEVMRVMSMSDKTGLPPEVIIAILEVVERSQAQQRENPT